MMNNPLYENNYTNIVEPKYGNKRVLDEDETLTKNILNNHSYSIPKEERVDMACYNSYSIDPIGCKDADDAFSIYNENNNLYFAIHIADPTEYIELHSPLFNSIIEQLVKTFHKSKV